MRRIAITTQHQDRIATVIVGLVLALAIVLTGCDLPGGKKSRRTASNTEPVNPMVTAVASSVTETPATVTSTESVEPRVVSYEEAEQSYTDRNYDDAVRLFSKYVDRKPENPWGHYMLGLSAWKSGERDRAVEAFERSITLDRTHVKSYLNLSRVLLELGRPGEAIARLDTALTLDSTSSVVFRLRGRALAGLAFVEDAADAYRHAIVLDSTDVWSMNNLGALYLGQGWFDEALYPLARAVELDSTQAVFLNNLGMALEHTGRFAQAVESYRRATVADATHVKAGANLARLEGRENEPFVDPVDLGALALEFVRRVDGWRGWQAPVVGIRE